MPGLIEDPTVATSFTAPWRKSAGGTGLPAAKTKAWNKLTLPSNTRIATGNILILFSGPKANPQNLQHALRKLGLNVDAYDLVDGSDQR